MKKGIDQRSPCPVSITLDIMGDKWSLLIIRDMMFYNKNTYGDFLKSPEQIATNILSDRLIQLEKAGIIVVEKYPDNKIKKFYKLSQKGIDLMPIILEIAVWGDKYFEIPEYPKTLAKETKKDRDGLVKHLSTKLKKVKQ